MNRITVQVACPYCKTVQDHLSPEYKQSCSNPKCEQFFAIEMRAVAVPFTRDEAAVMWAIQGMGYEAGFSAVELAIAQDLLEREFVFKNDKGRLDRTALGQECLNVQSG